MKGAFFLNEKDWQILKTIDEEKNFTRSAEKLYISQPALTYRINQIENELNIKVFSRSNLSIQPLTSINNKSIILDL